MAEITTITFGGITWHDVVNPGAGDIQKLMEKYDFHELDAEDCLTENQRPKIDEYDKYLFIVLHFPFVRKSINRIATAEVDIFIGAKFIITVHWGELPVIERIREECSREAGRRKYLDRGTGYFLYELTSELFDACFPIADNLWRTVNEIEKEVFDEEETRDLVQDIMILKRNIIACRRIITPERPVVSALEHKNKKFLPETLEVYFDDIVDKIEKLSSTLESLKEVADTLQTANESFISHTTSQTVKILTVFSVILLPLTLITGLFGMNVPIPHADSAHAFFWITTGMFVIVGTMVGFFVWRKWL